MERLTKTIRDEHSDIGVSIAERISTNELPEVIERLILCEREVPVAVGVDEAARLKVIDNCGMTCTFCHNEGTPVAAAYNQGNILLPNPTYRGGECRYLSNATALISYRAVCSQMAISTKPLGY